MAHSINNLRSQFTKREILSTVHLCAIKGGGGEDIRERRCENPLPTSNSTLIVKVTATKG